MLDFFQIVGFLTCAVGFTWCVAKGAQKLEKFLDKKDLVKDAIRKAKIEYKEKNK